MGYFKNTAIGISWVAGLRASTRAIALIRIIILARLLTPVQFGVFGIATIVLSFLEILVETGINVFLIQEKNDIDKYISSAWIVSILRGLILCLLIIVSSPLIVDFFNTQELYKFLLLISVVPLIRGFINPSVVKLQKNLQFNKEFLFRIAIFLIDSTVAIVLALILKDAISFIWGLISGAILEVILSFLFFKPVPSLNFNSNMVKKIIRRGKWVTAFGIFNYMAQEVDDIVVGKTLGTSFLGIYQMGYKLSSLPISEISDVTNRVVFPVYSKISEDKVRLFKAFKKTLLTVSFPITFLGGILFFLPKDLFTLVLGPNWTGVASILKILVIYGMLRAISGIAASLFLAVGKQSYVALMTFLRLSVLIMTIVPFTIQSGLVGASFSTLLSVLVELPLICYLAYLVFKSKQNV